LENVAVVVDELALPCGTTRLKLRGSDGGHNGLKSIQEVLGNPDYPRLRFGIGADFPKGHQIDYVLGRWDADQHEPVKLGIERSIKFLETFVLAGAATAMNQYNQ